MAELRGQAANGSLADVTEALARLRDAKHINRSDVDGNTALHYAALRGAGGHEVAEVLLRHDAKVDKHNHVGQTALWFAAERLDPALVAILLEHGAVPSTTSHRGRLPRDVDTSFAGVVSLLEE